LSGATSRLGNIVKTYLSYQWAKGFLNLGAEMEQTRITFQTLLGDVKKGNQLFKEINQFANVTPFNNRNLQTAARTMLSFGIVEERIMPNLKMIGDIASGDAEKLKSLTLAYSQVQSAGKLMGQDLLQLINAGFNPLLIISQKTGRPMSELKDAMSSGAISADMVTQAFMSATSEGGLFYNMMEKQSKTLSGKWSTFVGKFQYFMGKLSESQSNLFTSIVDKGIKALDYLLNNLDGIIRKIQSFTSWVGRNADAIKFWATMIGTMVTAYYAWIAVTKIAAAVTMAYQSVLFVVIGLTRGWAVAQRALNLAMAMNPIGLVIAGIAALIAAVVYAWNKFEWFRGTILGVWEVLKGFGNMIKEYVINRFWEIINGLTGLGQTLMHFFKGEWSKAWETGKKAASDLIGIESKTKLVKDSLRFGKDLGKNFSKGYTEGSAQVAAKKSTNLVDNLLGNNTPSSSIDGNKLLGEESKNNLKGITSGGSRPTNITINLGKFQDSINIYAQDVKEGTEEMRDIILSELTRVLNSANKVAAS
jgi:tape measure domain-containing protein